MCQSKWQRGVRSSRDTGSSSRVTLRTLSDVLDLVLPKVVKDAMFVTPELRDAIASSVVEQLLEKVSCGWLGGVR